MTQLTAHFDFESRATVDIKLGVDRYAEHHATQILCLGYKIGTGPTRVWRPLENEPFPRDLADHVTAGGRMVAHNCAFDRTMWNVVLRRSHPHVPELRIEQTDCTMVRALALGLPGGLDAVCKALKLPITKDLDGYAVMMKLCKPQRRAGQLYWVNDPALFERLYQYCAADIEAETPIDDLLPRLSDTEQQLWWLSERINQRGIKIDLENVRRCAELVELEGKSLALAVKQLTKGWAVPTQRAKLLDWLDNNGLSLPDMKKHTVRDAMRTEPPARLKRVLELQTEANRTSNAKLKKMLQRTCEDGRARSEYRFNGAGTGRWSGNGIQLQNLPRTAKGFKTEHALDIFGWLKHGPSKVREIIRREYGSPMLAASNCIRPLLTVDDGNEFICADYSNIEGRVLAWLAGEEWKLDAFRAYDAGTGHDLYKLAFAKAFGVPPESVDDDQRQAGKVIELSAGYQSGHGGFIAMAAGYDLDLELLSNVVHGQTPAAEWARFDKMYDADGAQHFELERREWTAIKILITKWRDANSRIRDFWKELEEAAIAAVAEPGKITGVNGKIHFCVADNFLWLRLPSGRRLAYAYPSLGEIATPWKATKQSVRVWGTDKGHFSPYHLYGGLLAENATQALARDILGLAMLGLERAGFPLVMHTHDECAAELPIGQRTLAEFRAVMCELPAWAEGLPVSVAGWHGPRYQKG